jgi:hypothetical protein
VRDLEFAKLLNVSKTNPVIVDFNQTCYGAKTEHRARIVYMV